MPTDATICIVHYKQIYDEEKQIVFGIHETLTKMQDQYDPDYTCELMNQASIDILKLAEKLARLNFDWDYYMNYEGMDRRDKNEFRRGIIHDLYGFLLESQEELMRLMHLLRKFTFTVNGLSYDGYIKVCRPENWWMWSLKEDWLQPEDPSDSEEEWGLPEGYRNREPNEY